MFQIVGAASLRLSKLNAGDSIADFVGPLGKPSEFCETPIEELRQKSILFVAGGVGSAPVYPQVKWLKEHGVDSEVILGAKNKDFVILEEEMRAYAKEVHVTTDDGSGAVYADKKTLAKARTHFGLVFQNFNLFPHYTVMKNLIDAPVSVQKKPKAEAEAKARELIVKMGLEGKDDMVPCELSGGQQQRVAIARALMLDPDVLFFDEPTSSLDPELTKGVLKVIRGLAEEHMTMVIVTHEMAFARDVADHVIFMDGGVIVEQGPAKQVIENPQQSRTRAFLHSEG